MGKVNRKTWGSIRNGLLILGAVAAVPTTLTAVRNFIASDPFQPYYHDENKVEPDYVLKLDHVDIRNYRGAELFSKADAASLEVSPGRSRFRLADVRNGMFTSKDGPIYFTAKQATFDTMSRKMTVEGGVNVKGKQFDLMAPTAIFSDRTSNLVVPQDVTGKLYGGTFKTSSFRYNTASQAFEAGKTHWQGLLALNLRTGQASDTPTRWDVNGDNIKGNPADHTITYTKGHAADGEIIVIADTIVQNRKTDVITATGNVRYFAPEANLVSDKIVVYHKEKRAVLTGHVRMLVKPEAEQKLPAKEEPIPEFKLLVADQVNVTNIAAPKTDEEKKRVDELRSSDSMKKYPAQLAADSIEYWYGKGSRHAIITGNPQARQDFTNGMWRHVWTDHALYDGEKDLLTLISGDKDKARMKNSYGDDLIAKQFVVSTKKDDEQFEGSAMTGTLVSTENDEADRQKNNPPPAGGGGGTTPPPKT